MKAPKARSKIRTTAQKSGRSQAGRVRSTSCAARRWPATTESSQVGITSRPRKKLRALNSPSSPATVSSALRPTASSRFARREALARAQESRTKSCTGRGRVPSCWRRRSTRLPQLVQGGERLVEADQLQGQGGHQDGQEEPQQAQHAGHRQQRRQGAGDDPVEGVDDGEHGVAEQPAGDEGEQRRPALDGQPEDGVEGPRDQQEAQDVPGGHAAQVQPQPAPLGLRAPRALLKQAVAGRLAGDRARGAGPVLHRCQGRSLARGPGHGQPRAGEDRPPAAAGVSAPTPGRRPPSAWPPAQR